jgi:hypothetical protein
MLLLWLVIRWRRVPDYRLLIALGLVIGIAAMTKFQAILLCLVLLVAVANLGPRDLLRRPLFWAGAALAAVIGMPPTLIWQQLHGWPQLRMAPVVAGEAEAWYGGRTGIAVELLVFAGLAGRSYGYFPPPPADRDVVLYVGRQPDRLRPYFNDGRRVGDIGEDMHAFVLTGQGVPWEPCGSG